MSTPHLQEALSAYLSGELTGQELANAEAHLGKCEECRTQLRRLQRVNALLNDAPSLEPSSDFAARVMQRADKEKIIRIPVRKAVAWAAVAAAIVVAVFLLRPQREVQPPQQISQKPPVEQKASPNPVPPPQPTPANVPPVPLSSEDRELIAHLDDVQDMELINNYDNLKELDTALLSQTENMQ